MTKQFYQTDVWQDETNSIWTSSVTYSASIQEHEEFVKAELWRDWGDPEDADAEEPTGSFADYISSINAGSSTLVLDAAVALAKLELLDIAGLDVAAIVAGGQPVKLVPERPVRVVVGLEGGIVQGASADAPVELIVLDYDVDSFDDDNPPLDVPQSDGSISEAYVNEPWIEHDPTWVEAVFAMEERSR